MGIVSDKIMNLTKQLLPTGRAFKIPKDGYFEKLFLSFSLSEERAYNDALAIYYSILPDNSNFSIDDATDWEGRLGLISNPLVSLDDRKAAISRKLNQPGRNPAKSNYLYMQQQLQLAGFNVYVFENRFPVYGGGYITKSPFDITGDSSLFTQIQHGQIQHGQTQHGKVYNNKVANHIEESKDLYFNLGGNYRSTFYIGGNPLGTFASIPLTRKDEFRQTILKLKPVQTVGLLLVNYI